MVTWRLVMRLRISLLIGPVCSLAARFYSNSIRSISYSFLTWWWWWLVVVCGGMWWSVFVCGGTWWYMVVCVCWYAVVHGGVWWYVVECSGM